jgi:TRAP-type C4-dicarboxylate transport system permease small subunit
MTETTAAEGAPRGALAAVARAAARALAAANVVARGTAYLSGLGFMIASVYITLDVLGRKFVGVSSAVTVEMGGYALLFGGTMALAFALATGAHVRIDVLMPKFPPKMRAILNYTAFLAMAFFATMLSIYSWKLALESWQTDARAMSFLRTPLILPQAFMSFGFTLLAVQAALMLAVALLESLRDRRFASFRVVQMEDLSEGL